MSHDDLSMAANPSSLAVTPINQRFTSHLLKLLSFALCLHQNFSRCFYNKFYISIQLTCYTFLLSRIPHQHLLLEAIELYTII